MSSVEIVPAQSSADMRAFVDLPWKLYAHEPNWVPPLKSEVRRLLDPLRHPFWKFSQRSLFLARRDGQTVGRIAAIVDENYNRFHQEKMGIWGFFECANDPEAAAGLFSAAEAWVRDKGMAFIRGPLNPSTNYEIGMLLEGFEHPPVVMMPYNPRYYLDLVAANGYAKEKDLLAMLIEQRAHASDRAERLARVIAKKNNVSIRPARFDDYANEMALIKEIYHASMERNWGFVPMTDEEIDEMGRSLMKIADPDLVIFIYHGQDPAGICVVLPDVNPILKRLNGRVGLLGLLKLLIYGRKIVGWRGTVFGFKRQYQKLGLPLVAFDYINRMLREKKSAEFLELGWNLEDNKDINQFDAEVGGHVYKKYRIYRKDL